MRPATEANACLRLWTKDGKYIAPQIYSKANANDLTKTLGYLGITGNVAILEFWLEGCSGTDAAKSISATLRDSALGVVATDTVNVSVINFDLVVNGLPESREDSPGVLIHEKFGFYPVG